MGSARHVEIESTFKIYVPHISSRVTEVTEGGVCFRSCSAGPPCARAPGRAQSKLLRTRLEPSCGLVPSFRAPEVLHTCTHMRPHPARTRLHVPAATHTTLFQPDCATKRAPTSTRSTGFCAIQVDWNLGGTTADHHSTIRPGSNDLGRRKEDSEPQSSGAPSPQPRTCFSCFDSFPWMHRKLVCESDTELKTLPSERTFRHLRAHGAATSLVKRPCTPRSGVVVSSAPAGLRSGGAQASYLRQQRARI